MKNIMWSFDDFLQNTALIYEDGTSLSYAMLQSATDDLASAAGGRCLVFSLCTNTIGSVVGYVSFLQNGIVPVLLSAHIDRELFDQLLNTYSPKYVWMPDDMTDKFDFTLIYKAYGYSLMKTGCKTEYPLHYDLALLLTTSGSTGSPKLVRQTYTNVRVNAEQIAEYLELDETERPVTTLPMNYTYGCSIINSHLLVGASILLTDKAITQKEFWIFMKEQKATSFGGVPFTYEMLDRMRFFRMDLPHLRTMTQAGGKLSPELHKKFAEYAKDKGKRFIVMYGACEATARMGYLPPEKSLEKYGSCGIAIPRGRFYLLDDNGQVIEENGVTGELVYEGPNVTMGYAECGDDLIKGDEFNGVLHTGDMAKRDEDGFYYIVGRKKRFLKIYGNRVNLDEVDRLIKAEFNFTDCASAGVDDHMYIFITDASIADDVRSFISLKTGLNQSAFKVIVIDSIPKNESGKILYKELEQYYSQDVI